MANTGKKIILTLKERKDPAGTFTGNTKPNLPSDPNYIPDSIDVVACPIIFTLACPVVISTRTPTEINYEFNLGNEVVKNPSIARIVVGTSVGGLIHNYTLPNTPAPNYFRDLFTGLNTGIHYDLIITYYDSANTIIKTCNATVA